MDLFNTTNLINILPFDGITDYYGKILDAKDSQFYLEKLLSSIEWRNDEAIIFGKHITTKRKVAWYGNEGYAYTYSNTTKQALVWTEELQVLKTMIEEITQVKFNSCLLNLYHNGEEGVTWHSDDEKSLGQNTTIAALSLGAERRFCFKHKANKQDVSLILENGSLLVMRDSTQTYWLHCLPKSKKIKKPRISLTFRTIVL